MDRKLFKLPFRENGITKFPCPSCNNGVLKVKKDTFHSEETKASLRAHNHPEWGPEEIDYIYSTLFECSNSACKDTVSSSGKGYVEQDWYYDDEGSTQVDYDNEYIPKIFCPSLKFFQLPKNIPVVIGHEIYTSFSLFFCDPSSSSNHIRTALENLLTYLKIKRYSTSNGKRNFLSLHNRIALLPNKYDHVKDIFFAIKWLGNAGSHSQHTITKDDVLDAYELMEELLVEIFANKRNQAKSLAKKINKRKGPKKA